MSHDVTPNWLDAAAQMPVAFSQVREDAFLDESVVLDLGDHVNVLMVASGGCTAALLASMRQIRRLHMVDPNPAQLALAQLKLRLLGKADTPQRLALLGHEKLPEEVRRSKLEHAFAELGLPQDVLGPLPEVAATGPDHAGRYERVFRALRRALVKCEPQLHSALRSTEIDVQIKAFSPDDSLGRLLDKALEETMSLSNLVLLFGKDATNNPVTAFHRHFAERIRWVMAQGRAAENPYLWQMLKGSYPKDHPAPWLTRTAPDEPPEVIATCARMQDVLQSETSAYDFVHLSNILDWLSPEEAARTLELAARALRPGGRILIRQLNSTLNIRQAGGMIEWLEQASDDLLQRDRSFFYRAIHLGRRR